MKQLRVISIWLSAYNLCFCKWVITVRYGIYLYVTTSWLWLFLSRNLNSSALIYVIIFVYIINGFIYSSCVTKCLWFLNIIRSSDSAATLFVCVNLRNLKQTLKFEVSVYGSVESCFMFRLDRSVSDFNAYVIVSI